MCGVIRMLCVCSVLAQASLEQDAVIARDTKHLVFELIRPVLVEAQGLRLASARLEQASVFQAWLWRGEESLSHVVWKETFKSPGLGALCVIPLTPDPRPL